MNDAISENQHFRLDHRIVLPDGQIRIVHEKGELKCDEKGSPVGMTSTIQDITKRKQIEDALRQSEERFDLAVQGSNVGIWDWDLLSRRFYLSPRMYELYEYDPQEIELTTESYTDSIHEEDRQNVLDAVRAHLEFREPYSVEFRRQTKQGKYLWLRSSGKATWNNDGIPTRMVGTTEDITERKHVEEELKAGKKRLQDILDSMFAFVGVYTIDGILVEANRAPLEAAGLQSEDVLGKPFWETYWWSYSEDVQNQLKDALHRTANGEAVRYDVPVRVADGKLITIDVTFSPLYDENGHIVQLIGFAVDITEREQAEQELKLSAEIMENMAEGVCLLRASDGCLVFTNPRFDEIFGYETGELIGEHTAILNAPSEKTPKETAAEILKTLEETGVWSGEVHNIRKDETPFWTHSSVSTFEHPQHGKVNVAVVEDITERKLAEQNREKLFKELEDRNAEMERFTYTVSHDLKSPLITIKGFLGMLADDIEKENRAGVESDMSRISGAADRMAQLLDELLELSRVSRIVNPHQNVSLADLAENAVELHATRISDFEVQIDISPDLPVIHGDQVRLQEVMQNLIDNAVKFTSDQQQPRIEIGSRQDNGELICYVRDNGFGIDSRYHEKIFGLFEQLDPQKEGTGIGLAIVKRIIDVHNGRIWVESEGLGKGATFCFTIPETIAEEQSTLST